MRNATVILAAGALTMVAGCTAEPPRSAPTMSAPVSSAPASSAPASPGPAPASPTATALPAQLSAGSPSARFTITDRATTQIRVRVVAITNPAQQALTLAVTLDGLDIGSVAVHPPTAPAQYLLALPPNALDRVRGGQATLSVTLAALRPDEAIRDDVRLTVSAP